jgi:hypothetical protein
LVVASGRFSICRPHRQSFRHFENPSGCFLCSGTLSGFFKQNFDFLRKVTFLERIRRKERYPDDRIDYLPVFMSQFPLLRTGGMTVASVYFSSSLLFFFPRSPCSSIRRNRH